ncbi:MAG TPA: hypothetical protein VF808_06510 [Ktedonobacterales bacterium]
MTNQQILEEAIRKAIDGGWQPPFPNVNVFVPDLKWIEFNNLPGARHVTMEPYTLVFDHGFAKALWGDVHKRWVPARTKTNPTTGTTYTQSGHYQRVVTQSKLPAWQWQLQQMVIADDPIKYLASTLDDHQSDHQSGDSDRQTAA